VEGECVEVLCVEVLCVEVLCVEGECIANAERDRHVSFAFSALAATHMFEAGAEHRFQVLLNVLRIRSKKEKGFLWRDFFWSIKGTYLTIFALMLRPALKGISRSAELWFLVRVFFALTQDFWEILSTRLGPGSRKKIEDRLKTKVIRAILAWAICHQLNKCVQAIVHTLQRRLPFLTSQLQLAADAQLELIDHNSGASTRVRPPTSLPTPSLALGFSSHSTALAPTQTPPQPLQATSERLMDREEVEGRNCLGAQPRTVLVQTSVDIDEITESVVCCFFNVCGSIEAVTFLPPASGVNGLPTTTVFHVRFQRQLSAQKAVGMKCAPIPLCLFARARKLPR
jgi:hypothetical protein